MPALARRRREVGPAPPGGTPGVRAKIHGRPQLPSIAGDLRAGAVAEVPADGGRGRCAMRLLRLLPRFRRAYAELAALEAREAWPRPQVEAFQLARLNAVWGHAVAHVPHYRRLREAAALPPRFGSLEEFRSAVPLLSRSAV